jgi:hypothetical protein
MKDKMQQVLISVVLKFKASLISGYPPFLSGKGINLSKSMHADDAGKVVRRSIVFRLLLA